MTFDSSKTIINIRIKLFGATIAFLAFIVLTYIAKMIKYPLLGMSDTFWTVMLVGIYLIIAFLPSFLNYQFIFYSDDSEKIVIRYFTAGIVGGRKNSVEIDKRTFSGYKIESRLFGLIQSITLFQKYQEGVAEYPKIYISALSQKEKSKVIKSLNSYTPQA
ncbi:MAG TPA: hypothetical protein VMV77_07330 [Bacteroidales bacterium]|nr:hypothetical protein [Bacteroidales bacterium]